MELIVSIGVAADPIHLVFSISAAFILLVLPGYAVLRFCVPSGDLDFLPRLAIAPGITSAGTVLLFTWAQVFSLKLGPLLPWLIILLSLVSLFVLRREKSRLSRLTTEHWLGGLTLLALIVLLLIVRFRSTHGWIVPPGIDSAQHTIIVQLLLDHHGLFESWAPYSDSETFTYHFGFHAITALFAWMTGADALYAVSIMARVIGACAVGALFALVGLFTRSVWGGVFAVAIWELYSRHLYFFDPSGRWTLLTGLAILPCALVLFALFLRERQATRIWPPGILTTVTVAGLLLAQYKSAVIFAVLATALVCHRCVAAFFSKDVFRWRSLIRIFACAFGVAALALLLVAPRLGAIMQAKTGQHLQRIVLQAPPPNPSAFGAPTLNAVEIFRTGFNNPQKVAASCLALMGGIIILLRRREAIWFAAGWLAVTVVMNPGLIGIDRAGVIDEIHWKFAVQTAIAAMAGLTVGLVCEALEKRRTVAWDALWMAGAMALSAWGAARLQPLPQSSRFVLPDDLRLMTWIAQHLPAGDVIAARSFFDHGHVQGYDAAAWLPYFTRHQTNQTNLAAALEKAPLEAREKLRNFTRELYARDMSTPESAHWMRDEGFRWFYTGAIQPELDRKLLEQIARNPAIEMARSEGMARLYRVR